MTKFYSDPIEHSSKVCMVSVTPDAEKHMGYVARVSNPKNQNNPDVAGLLKYCICLLYTSPSPRDGLLSRMPSSA